MFISFFVAINPNIFLTLVKKRCYNKTGHMLKELHARTQSDLYIPFLKFIRNTSTNTKVNMQEKYQ